MKIRFLLDEHIAPGLIAAILRLEPIIDVVRVGDQDAPPLGTPDPDILHYLERTQRALITNNRRTIPRHVADHLTTGGRHWGVFFIRAHVSYGRLAEEIYLLWSASEADEWIDQMTRLPL